MKASPINRTCLGALLLIAAQSVHSESNISSYFGFTANLPDDWFVLGPNEVAKANEGETVQSLAIPEIQDQELLNSIFEKVKSGGIEFYYDKKYINKKYKNHISAQLSSPITFDSTKEFQSSMDLQCKSLPAELSKIFGETVKIHSCRTAQLNKRVFLRHAYTVPSKNLIIINDQIPVNSEYSMILVGGSGNDSEGMKRVQKAQLALINAITEYLGKQVASN